MRIISIILLFFSLNANSATFTTRPDGTWSTDGGTTSCGACVPGFGDNLVVNHNSCISIPIGCFSVNGGNYSGNLTINSGGYLHMFGAVSISSGAVVVINDGGVLDVDGSLTINTDNFILNGILDFFGSLTNNGIVTGSGSVVCSGGNSINHGTWPGLEDGCSCPIPCGSILPVELLFFEARREQGGIILSWATASETNNDFFAIEKSDDGNHFSTIDFVKGAGNSGEILNYNYLDVISSDIVYYRLRQVDFDGMNNYSNVVVVNSYSYFSFYTVIVGNELTIKTNSKIGKCNVLMYAPRRCQGCWRSPMARDCCPWVSWTCCCSSCRFGRSGSAPPAPRCGRGSGRESEVRGYAPVCTRLRRVGRVNQHG